MRIWMNREANLVMEWVTDPHHDRASLFALAQRIGRTPEAIVHYLRRKLPPELFPWRRKPRWKKEEELALKQRGEVNGRSRDAVYKYAKRKHIEPPADGDEDEDSQPLKVTFVAESLGVSRTQVYLWLDQRLLRRFKGGVAESSFVALLKDHPELVRFDSLSRDMQEWLVVMGYENSSMQVKEPSVRGLLKERADDGTPPSSRRACEASR